MIKLFFTGYIQVLLVVLNTYCISKDFVAGIVVCSFGISYFWTHNVKKVAFGNEMHRIIYASGALVGGLSGYYLGKFLAK